MKGLINILFFVLFVGSINAQTKEKEDREDRLDSTFYTSYKNNPIMYMDLGYNAAPSSIKYPFPSGIKEIEFRHNFKTMVGVGFAYKWFALRLSAALIGNSKPISRFGEAQYLDFGANFSLKKTYSEVNLRIYSGYVIKNAKDWDTSFNDLKPNDTKQTINTHNIDFSFWYFDNPNFKIDAFNGKRAYYNKPVTTWYLDGKVDFYGINNDKGSLIPSLLSDSTNTKTRAKAYNAVDLGVIPGIAHVTRLKNWQFGMMAGLGPRLQIKGYSVDGVSSSLASVVLRYNARFVAGYSVPKFFSMFSLELDNKSIKFNDLKYRLWYYSMRVSIGYRFKNTKK